MNKNKVLMFLFVGSESFFFLALILSYIYYSRKGGELSSSANYLDIGKTAIFTFFLLTSSLTIFLADIGLRQNRRKMLLVWLFVTIIFGIIFLAGQGSEYARLFKVNLTISRNVFGSAFFTLTGFHGLHVLIGLIVLSVILILLLSGRYKTIEQTAFRSASIYWHFVDAVWIAVFSVVYIGALL